MGLGGGGCQEILPPWPPPPKVFSIKKEQFEGLGREVLEESDAEVAKACAFIKDTKVAPEHVQRGTCHMAAVWEAREGFLNPKRKPFIEVAKWTGSGSVVDVPDVAYLEWLGWFLVTFY